MEDIVQKAIEETIPEIIREAQRECIEEAAIQQAGAIMVGIAEAASEEGIVLSQDVQAEIHHTATAAINIQEKQQVVGAVPPDPMAVEGEQPPETEQTEPVDGGTIPVREGDTGEIMAREGLASETPLSQEPMESLVQNPQMGPAATTESQPIEVIAEEGTEEDDEFDRERWVQGTVAPELSKDTQRKLAMKGVFLVVVTRISDENDIFVTSIADPPLSIQKQRDIRCQGGQVLISLTEDSYDIYQMEVDPTLIPKSKALSKAKKRTYEERVRSVTSSGFGVVSESSIRDLIGDASEDSSAKESAFGSPKAVLPKQRRKTTTQRGKRTSKAEEEETSEGQTPKRPVQKPSGKNLSLMKQQAAEATGRATEDFGSPEVTTRESTAHRPSGFSSSLYGLERGSTRVFGGKGKGKSGRRKPKKPKKKVLEGWEDPQVTRALENRPPPGAIITERNDEACRTKIPWSKND